MGQQVPYAGYFCRCPPSRRRPQKNPGTPSGENPEGVAVPNNKHWGYPKANTYSNHWFWCTGTWSVSNPRGLNGWHRHHKPDRVTAKNSGRFSNERHDFFFFLPKLYAPGPIGLESFGQSIIPCGWIGIRPLDTQQTSPVTSQTHPNKSKTRNGPDWWILDSWIMLQKRREFEAAIS